jgi:hypothetical protein
LAGEWYSWFVELHEDKPGKLTSGRRLFAGRVAKAVPEVLAFCEASGRDYKITMDAIRELGQSAATGVIHHHSLERGIHEPRKQVLWRGRSAFDQRHRAGMV